MGGLELFLPDAMLAVVYRTRLPLRPTPPLPRLLFPAALDEDCTLRELEEALALVEADGVEDRLAVRDGCVFRDCGTERCLVDV